MIDTTAAHLALRTRARSVTVATTGSATLSATATGFARSSGSFVSDGFYAGMEVAGTGFSAANNAPATITKVLAGSLTIDGTRTVQAATAGRTLTVGWPSNAPQENIEYEPVAGTLYIRDEFIPGTSSLIGVRDGGTVEETGLYVLTLHGIANTGFPAIRKYMDALQALFAPGTTLTAGSHTVRVRGDFGPRAGQIRLVGTVPVCQLTVGWRAFSTNAIAA